MNWYEIAHLSLMVILFLLGIGYLQNRYYEGLIPKPEFKYDRYRQNEPCWEIKTNYMDAWGRSPYEAKTAFKRKWQRKFGVPFPAVRHPLNKEETWKK